MNETTCCPNNEWLKCNDKANEVITLLKGMTYREAKQVLDMVNADLWNHAVIVKEQK